MQILFSLCSENKWSKLKNVVKLGNILGKAASTQKQSTNTGAYQLFDLASKIPVAKDSQSETNTQTPKLSNNLDAVLKGPSTTAKTFPVVNAKVFDSPNPSQPEKLQSPTERLNREPMVKDSGSRPSAPQPVRKWSMASASKVKGVLKLFPDRKALEEEAEEEEVKEDKSALFDKKLSAFMTEGAGSLSDSSSEEDRFEVLESRHTEMFRRIAKSVLIWNVFFKRRRLPPGKRFRHTAMMVLRYLRMQRQFLTAKQLHNKKIGLRGKALWGEMKVFYQANKHLRPSVNLKLRGKDQNEKLSEPVKSSGSKIQSSIKSSNKSDSKTTVSKVMQNQYAEEIPAVPKLSIKAAKQKLGRVIIDGKHVHVQADVDMQKNTEQLIEKLSSQHKEPSQQQDVAETIISDGEHMERLQPTTDRTAASELSDTYVSEYTFDATIPQIDEMDVAEKMNDWLSAQRDVLSTIRTNSELTESVIINEDDEISVIVVDGIQNTVSLLRVVSSLCMD